MAPQADNRGADDAARAASAARVETGEPVSASIGTSGFAGMTSGSGASEAYEPRRPVDPATEDRLPAEEMSAELAATGPARLPDSDEELRRSRSRIMERQAQAGRSLGIFSLAMAIASLFVWPLLLGLTAAVLGYFSYRQGARGLGVWSIAIGLLAAAAYVVFIPFIAILS